MYPRAGFVVAVALALAACHKAVPATTPGSASSTQWLGPEAGELSDRAERLIRAQDDLVWRHWTEGAPLDLSGWHEEQRALYTREALERLDVVRRRSTDPDQARALELLRAHFAGEYVALTTAAEQEAFDALQTGLNFEVDGQVYPLRDLERLLARERNALRRQALHKAGTEAVTKLGPAAERLHQALDAARTEAAYRSRLELASALRRTRPERVKALAERVLSETDEAFRKVLEQLAARELRLPFESVRARDLPRMFRSRDVDELFPAKEIPARAEATVRGMGLDLHRALKLDDRPLRRRTRVRWRWRCKSPGTSDSPSAPSQGSERRSAICTSSDTPSTRRTRSSPRSRCRGWGAAPCRARSPSSSPAWSRTPSGWSRRPGLPATGSPTTAPSPPRGTSTCSAGMRGARCSPWRSGPERRPIPRSRGAEIMSRALGVTVEEYERVHHLLEADTSLASASALESTLLAHQLRAQLERRFGPTWWEQSAAGDYLRSLWAHGTALDAEELARAAGEAGLAPDALFLWLDQALGLAGRST